MLITDTSVMPHTSAHWYSLLLGVVTAAISNFFLVEAVKILGSSLASIFGCLEPVVAVIIGTLCFMSLLRSLRLWGLLLFYLLVVIVALATHIEQAKLKRVKQIKIPWNDIHSKDSIVSYDR